MSHPQHPSCTCGKALFKSPVAAKVKPSDPYAFCRNPKCEHYTFRRVLGKPGFDPKLSEELESLRKLALRIPTVGKVVGKKAPAGQALIVASAKAHKEKLAKTVMAPSKPLAIPATPPPPTKPVSKRGVRRAAMPSSEAPPRVVEPEAIMKARERLRELLQEATAGAPREAVGLVLAILSQETKSQKAAEALIDEFQLDKKFGLQKFTPNNG